MRTALSWRLRRMANMSAPELAHRAREFARKRAGRGREFGWGSFRAEGHMQPPAALAQRLRRDADDGCAESIRAAAERLLAGEFSALGAVWPRRDSSQLFPAELWRTDPVRPGHWPGPELYCFDVPYRHVDNRGDVKYVWELSRLQFLPTLAADAALNRRPGSAAAVEAALASWAEANPPYQGLAWNSGIELGLRALSIGLAVSLCGDMLTPSARAIVERLLRAHHLWLDRFPSRYSSANNHCIAEALGLLVIELLLPDLGDGRRARAVLEREALRQILPDGVGAEQSPTYAAFTAEMLLVANLFLAAAGRPPLRGEVGERLAAFANWVAWMSDAQGRCPRIGDDDEGRVVTLGGECAYPAAIARAVASAHGACVWPPCAAQPQLRDALFPAPPPPTPPSGVRTFPAGGYTIVRERRAGRAVFLMMDHGPLGYLSIAAHGHADALAFVLSLDEQDILVDPGTYLYHSGGAWRDAFRSTRAHNTLCLGDKDQSVIAGPFNWGAKARARLLEVQPGAQWRVRAAHDGYVRRFGVEHVREWRATPEGFSLLDRLTPSASATECSLGFQLALGLEAEGAGAEWTVARDGRALLQVKFRTQGDVTTFCGDPPSRRGWVSGAFGEKAPAPQLVWRGVAPPEGVEVLFQF